MLIFCCAASSLDDCLNSCWHGVDELLDVVDVQLMVPDTYYRLSERSFVDWFMLRQLSTNNLPTVFDGVQIRTVSRP